MLLITGLLIANLPVHRVLDSFLGKQLMPRSRSPAAPIPQRNAGKAPRQHPLSLPSCRKLILAGTLRQLSVALTEEVVQQVHFPLQCPPFESLKTSLGKLRVQNAILDGEIICIDRHGISQFNQLFSRQGTSVFYAFDLLWLNHEDLRNHPLIDRKERLRELIRRKQAGTNHLRSTRRTRR